MSGGKAPVKAKAKKPAAKKVAKKDEGPAHLKHLREKFAKEVKVYSGATDVRKANTPKAWISTGCYPLDLALNGLGLPTGRIILLSSDTGKGKTLLANHIMVEFQRRGGICYLFETEGSWSATWAEQTGLDLAEEKFTQPEAHTLEQVFAIIEHQANYHNSKTPNTPIVFVLDSLTSTPVGRTLEREWHELEKDVGSKSRFSSPALEKLERVLKRTNCTFVVISQLRDVINMGGGKSYGPKEKITGGRAWEFYNSVHIRLRDIPKGDRYPYKEAKKGDRIHEPIGKEVEAYIMKSKVGPSFRKAFLPLYFELGFGHPMGIDDDEAYAIWLEDRKFITKYTGDDAALKKAKAKVLSIPSVTPGKIEKFRYVGIGGFRKLLGREGIRDRVKELMYNNRSTRGVRDEESVDPDDPTTKLAPDDADGISPAEVEAREAIAASRRESIDEELRELDALSTDLK